MNTKAFNALLEAEKLKPQIEIIDSNLKFQNLVNYLRKLVEDNTINKELVGVIYKSLEEAVDLLGVNLSMDLIIDLLKLMREPLLVEAFFPNSQSLFQKAYDLREEYISEFNPEAIEGLSKMELLRYKNLFFDRRVATVYETLDSSIDDDQMNLRILDRRITVVESNETLKSKIDFLARRTINNNSRAILHVLLEINELLKTLSSDIVEEEKLRLIEILNTFPDNKDYNDILAEILERYKEEPTEG